MRVLLCDFDDSFTYNIFTELNKISAAKVEVIELKEILSTLQELASSDEKILVVLGPGPGHPSQYSYLLKTIASIMKCSNVFLCGICLGHQLILQALGVEAEHCYDPIHGRTRNLKLPLEFAHQCRLTESIEVQFYNSLAVKLTQKAQQTLESHGYDYYCYDDEIMIVRGERLISYQFHPESIGTTCPDQFFLTQKDFLL